MQKLLLLISIILSASFAFADSHFEEALNAFQKGEYDQAQGRFLELTKDPHYKFAALYNLGSIAVKQKKPGLALAYYRLAEKISPRDKDLTYNIHYVTQEFKILPPAGNISAFEVFRQEVLNRFSFLEFSLLFFVLLLIFVIIFWNYLKRRYSEENPPRPPLALFVSGFILFLSLSLMLTKLFDSCTNRGTIVVSKAEIKSGPGSQNATLTEAPEGCEVFINDSSTNESGTWKQVTIPGNLTGWVSDQSLIQTSGEGPW